MEPSSYSNGAIVVKDISDSQDVLKKFNVAFTHNEYYLQVGEIPSVQGWVLHLTGTRTQFLSLLELVVPALLQTGVPFKIARDKQTALYLVDGGLGYAQLGKLVKVYPRHDVEALHLAKKLMALTAGFQGPAIPTDLCLGSIVYTSFTGFNPITQVDENGKPGKFIYNSNGQLVPDTYTIPFFCPPNIPWPFTDIKALPVPTKQKLWNDRYRPEFTIKYDVKGRVLKGLYLKKWWQVKPCIIKEGKSNMWADPAGRDIQDRLLWQHDLYMNLGKDIPTPRIFDLFRQNDDLYLVMEFIKGQALTSKIGTIYNGSNWPTLTPINQLQLIDYGIRIIEIIEKLHNKGYVHRDITPDNFLLDNKDNFFLIDMELAYSIREQRPSPTFQLGTAGHISPEQYAGSTPTNKEDIYGLGGLMIKLFTGLLSLKFDKTDPVLLRQNLYFFTKNALLADLITSCMNSDPGQRPSLETINTVLTQCKANINNPTPTEATYDIFDNNIIIADHTQLINKALKGLTSQQMFSPEQLWHSFATHNDKYIGNEQLNRHTHPGFHGGLAGILYLVARAHQLSYDISPCVEAYQKSWEFIYNKCASNLSVIGLGLYDGTTGIALAASEGVRSGLLNHSPELTSFLQQCFNENNTILDIAAGVAGQGLTLLQCSHVLSSDFMQEHLNGYIKELLECQQKDGHWLLNLSSSRRRHNTLGLSYGVAGIVYFLLTAVKHQPAPELILSISKALKWLVRQLVRNKTGHNYWYSNLAKKLMNKQEIQSGSPGIALCFIKAYEVLKEPLYLDVAEQILSTFPAEPLQVNFTQAKGLARTGEVYLEAYRIFQTTNWLQRSDWIANVFAHTFFEEENKSAYWLTNMQSIPEAAFMTGNSGIIHFLMRHQKKDKLTFPVLG